MISGLGFTQQAGASTSTSQLQSSSVGSENQRPMADLNSSLESSGLSGDEKSTTTASTSTAEAMMWEGWTSNSHTDSASTSHNINNNNNNNTMALQQFHHPAGSDMLCNMMSSFHPLTVDAFPALNFNASVSFGSEPSKYLSYGKPSPEIMKWDHASPHQENSLPWPGTTFIHDEDSEQSAVSHMKTFFGQTSKKQLELFSSFGNLADEMNPGLNQMPWTDAAYESSTTTRSQQVLNFLPNQRLEVLNLARHRRGDEILNGPASKRAHVADDSNGNSPGIRRTTVMDSSSCRLYSHSTGSPGSQAMEMFAIGPALNTNGKPRARRGSATDPQSVYARHRREKINGRLKTLQHLVPNGTKVDIVTMLDEAIHYVQFLQLQVKLLKSDKYWIHATPNTYKGIDLTNPPTEMQGLGSSA